MFDREWLHVHILDGVLYIFADDGHWRDTCKQDWSKSVETTFKKLEGECCLGYVGDDRREYMFRIALKPRVTRYSKFGMPYTESV